MIFGKILIMELAMSAQKLLLDRIEFSIIKVESVEDDSFKLDEFFPQLEFDSDGVNFLSKSSLAYSPEEDDDPRHFRISYALKADPESSEVKIPYSLEVEAVAFLRYVGGDDFSGADRFRAVRFSGFQILHGAIREMVSNLTARGRHGIWNLPARNFGELARDKANEDEQARQRRLEASSATKALTASVPKKRARKKLSQSTAT